ncbi:MAG: SsrA-binding protein SmpB [Ekhidna sp.]|nr:SsrA-binding protein SmpB [Ekhidna sp.]MBC6410804.1 SsrA-binding protein SmpB [Ekhidna sp.]MBC6427572.1 SsrA-binding protein SmpB [Ekhidna sp.]
MPKERFSNNIQIKNRKASYEFEFLEKFEAGMVLKGTEIKSIREGKASVQEAYCYLQNDEAFIKGMNISPYSNASFESHIMTRERKLLLKKKEIQKLRSKTEEKGLTIVPVKVFINNRGFAKLEIALARGKKLYDKRNDIKKKDHKRELDRLKV